MLTGGIFLRRFRALSALMRFWAFVKALLSDCDKGFMPLYLSIINILAVIVNC
jgi:hypothetical protein